MENVDNVDQESNFVKTEKVIRRAYLRISQEQSGVNEKDDTIKLMEKKCIDLEDKLSKSEANYSKMNESLQKEIESFRTSVPNRISYIDDNQNELEILLDRLENEKNRLLDQANRLTKDFHNIKKNIQKVSNLDKSIKYKAKTNDNEFDEAQLDEIKQESRQVIDNIGQIVQQINESKKTLLQYESAAVQMHTFVLQELGLSFTIQKQIYEHQFFLSNSLDNLKSAILGEKQKQKFASKDIEKTKDELHFQSQKIELRTHNDIQIDANMKKISIRISAEKSEILKKRSLIIDILNRIQKYEEKKKNYREKAELFIDHKKGQIQKILQEISKIKKMTSGQKKETSAHDLEMRCCKSVLINIQNDIEEERQKEMSLEDFAKQIELLELKRRNEIKRAEKAVQKNRQIFTEISKKVLEQKNIAYQIELERANESEQDIFIESPQMDFKDVSNEINTTVEQTEEIKKQIIKELENKKIYLKQKSELLSRISEASKNSYNLERNVKEFKESIYYQKSMNVHNELLMYQTISTEIDEKIKENEKKKTMIKKKKGMLFRVMTECGIKLIGDKYVCDKQEEEIEPPKRKQRLHHFIEKYCEIIHKVEDIKQALTLKVSPTVQKSILDDWDEFIEKQTSTI